jgi:hypothetical protein
MFIHSFRTGIRFCHSLATCSCQPGATPTQTSPTTPISPVPY